MPTTVNCTFCSKQSSKSNMTYNLKVCPSNPNRDKSRYIMKTCERCSMSILNLICSRHVQICKAPTVGGMETKRPMPDSSTSANKKRAVDQPSDKEKCRECDELISKGSSSYHMNTYSKDQAILTSVRDYWEGSPVDESEIKIWKTAFKKRLNAYIILRIISISLKIQRYTWRGLNHSL